LQPESGNSNREIRGIREIRRTQIGNVSYRSGESNALLKALNFRTTIPKSFRRLRKFLPQKNAKSTRRKMNFCVLCVLLRPSFLVAARPRWVFRGSSCCFEDQEQSLAAKLPGLFEAVGR
jgi:hypothetical protein